MIIKNTRYFIRLSKTLTEKNERKKSTVAVEKEGEITQLKNNIIKGVKSSR